MSDRHDLTNALRDRLSKRQFDDIGGIAALVLRQDPENRDALYSMGMHAWRKGIPDLAVHYLERALSGRDAPADRLTDFCRLLGERGRYMDVSAVAARVLEHRPDLEDAAAMKAFADAYLGSAFYNVSDWAASWKHYAEAARHATPSRIQPSVARNVSKGLMSSAGAIGILYSHLTTVSERLAEAYGDVGGGGLFEGLLTPTGASALVPPCQRIGSYEAELAPLLSRAIAERGYRHLINVGSSWGYYTAGMARMLPRSMTVAFETDADTREMACRTARLNKVEERIRQQGECTVTNIREAFSPECGSLVIMDCEGYERTLLDPEAVPEFAFCDILLECHDFVDASITPTVLQRFSGTHDIQKIEKTIKVPFDYPKTERLSFPDRWFAVMEPRSEVTWWLWLRTRNASLGF